MRFDPDVTIRITDGRGWEVERMVDSERALQNACTEAWHDYKASNPMHSDCIYLYSGGVDEPFDFLHVPPGPVTIDFDKHDWQANWGAIRPPLTQQQFIGVVEHFQSMGVDSTTANTGAKQAAAVVKAQGVTKNALKRNRPDLRAVRKEIEDIQDKLHDLLHILSYSSYNARSYLSLGAQGLGHNYDYINDRNAAMEGLNRLSTITWAALEELPKQKNEKGIGRRAGVPRDRLEFDSHYCLIGVFKETVGRLPKRDYDPDFEKLLRLIGWVPAPAITRKAVEMWKRQDN